MGFVWPAPRLLSFLLNHLQIVKAYLLDITGQSCLSDGRGIEAASLHSWRDSPSLLGRAELSISRSPKGAPKAQELTVKARAEQ